MRPDTICISNLNLCYRTVGAGPDVLFIHGWASSGRMWGAAMAALAGRFRCWAVDLAGFGDSDKPGEGWYALPNFTATVRQFAAMMGLERAHVVGHSMGGMIALDLAAAAPQFVNRLAVVNPVVTGHIRAPLPARLEQAPKVPLLELARYAWPVALRYALRPPLSASASVRNLFSRGDDMFKPSPESAMGSIRAMVNYDCSPRLPAVQAPTLVVLGDHDPVVAPAEGRIAAACIPNARLVTLSAGHQIADERPREFAELLGSFLAAED